MWILKDSIEYSVNLKAQNFLKFTSSKRTAFFTLYTTNPNDRITTTFWSPLIIAPPEKWEMEIFNI
jgi:hypothetical protein